MMTQTVDYKGHRYNLLWKGATKYGERAKLEFRDGTKQFWVDACLVSEPRQHTGRGTCEHCGEQCNPKYRTCFECSHGGQSFYDRYGNFVLGSDD